MGHLVQATENKTELTSELLDKLYELRAFVREEPNGAWSYCVDTGAHKAVIAVIRASAGTVDEPAPAPAPKPAPKPAPAKAEVKQTLPVPETNK